MLTKIISFVDQDIDNRILEEASNVLKQGGLVAFPTETVYGLGGDATDKEASKKIYQAKGRPSDNPLIVHISDFSQLEAISCDLPKEAKILSDAFWPGPLTMVVKKNSVIPYETTGGLDTVAVRMPSHRVARELIKQSGIMIAAPSANKSGRPSPTTAEHVYEDLCGDIDIIIDDGPVDIGLESTIIDLSEEKPMILRPGFITKDMLEAVLGEVSVDPGIAGDDKGTRPKAPGMRYRHYAPKAPLTIVEGDTELVIEKINEMTKQANNKRVGVIATEETRNKYIAKDVLVVGNRNDENSIAHNLFAVLRSFDEMSVDLIYSESFDSMGIGMAIMNRLLKAAGHSFIKV